MTLTHLINIGPKMEQYLYEIGVHDETELRAMSAVTAYIKIKSNYPFHMNRMGLYALYGAIYQQNCINLSQDIKNALENELLTADV